MSTLVWSGIDRLTKTRSVRIGNHRVILDGLVTIGPNFLYAVVVIAAAVAAVITVYKSVMSFSIILTLIFLVLSWFELVFLLRTIFTDPGIVVPASRLTSSSSHQGPLGSIVNGVTIERSFCPLCRVHIPTRGKHCGICNCCVDRHDHHCKFLSNCIGIRNYRPFILLIVTTCVISLYTIFIQLFASSLSSELHWVIFATASALAVVTGNLAIYHLKLVARGQTSYEQHKGVHDAVIAADDVSPFSLGNWRANINAFLTAPQEPSRIFQSQIFTVGPRPTVKGKTVVFTSGSVEEGDAHGDEEEGEEHRLYPQHN